MIPILSMFTLFLGSLPQQGTPVPTEGSILLNAATTVGGIGVLSVIFGWLFWPGIQDIIKQRGSAEDARYKMLSDTQVQTAANLGALIQANTEAILELVKTSLESRADMKGAVAGIEANMARMIDALAEQSRNTSGLVQQLMQAAYAGRPPTPG